MFLTVQQRPSRTTKASRKAEESLIGLTMAHILVPSFIISKVCQLTLWLFKNLGADGKKDRDSGPYLYNDNNSDIIVNE